AAEIWPILSAERMNLGLRFRSRICRIRVAPEWHGKQMKHVHASIIRQTFQADSHLLVSLRRLRTVSFEQLIPPWKQESEIRVLFLELLGVMDTMDVGSDQDRAKYFLKAPGEPQIGVREEILQRRCNPCQDDRHGRRR